MNMERSVNTSITALYKVVDGWHVFVSPELPGLYVASQDLAKAYNDVARSIEMLLSLDSGIKCAASPDLPLDEFVATVKGRKLDSDSYVPAERRFSVHSACV